MADRTTIACLNAAGLALEDDNTAAFHSLLLLAIVGLLAQDVEARKALERLVSQATVRAEAS